MHLLFDLDGTLTDSSTGIVRCLNHAVIGLGCRPVPAERLRPMIGTPLTAIFRTVLHSDDVRALDHAVEMYRERFNTIGMFQNSLFPGILEALDVQSGAGHRLQIIALEPPFRDHRSGAASREIDDAQTATIS